MTLSSTDVSSHVQPRFSSRRERKPGARERHSLQRCRLSPEPRSYSPRITPSPRPHTVHPQSAYSVTAADHYSTGRYAHSQPQHEEEIQLSHYKELSTIEDIRADVKSKEKKGTPRKHNLPDWMLDLDINLDVSAIDIVPPFEAPRLQDNDETFLEMPTMSIADDTRSEASSRCEELPVDEHIVCRQEVQPTQQTRQSTARALSQERSETPFSRTHHTFRSGPRRYQGDKRVMSLQQGGIRSTPMQPKSKKFINQMITYQHMKVHDKKLKKAKPAVDTKMPATFKIALDRKRLVETRLSESWTGSYMSLPSSSRTSPSPSRTQGTASR